MDDVNRRLAGILAADVVGYSAMLGTNEPGTLARVRALRTDVVEPHATAHGGRLFKTTGDGFFAAFASAVQALRCAIAIQDTLRANPDGLRLRIGVHQGEVVPDGDDLLGDGVIIAARLEPLAESGGICISARVREDAAGKVAIDVDDLGTPDLKNIAQPVRFYRVRLDVSEHPSLALPDKPSLVVLPFENMSGDAEQEYFADGMVVDITTALSRIRSLFVIARNSAFTYKGRAVDVRQVGRELGVRYVLEGSVRKLGSRVRITGQLVDATTGAHLWADHFDGAATDIFVVQDQIADSVARAIVPAISHAEQRRISRKPPESLDAWETYQRGLWHEAKQSASDNAHARMFFQQAIRLDPAFTAAHTELAHTYLRDGGVYGVRSPQEAADLATAQAAAALAIDPLDAEAHTAMSGARHLCGDSDGAAIHAVQALVLDPNSVRARRADAVRLLFGGNPAQARELFLDVLRLNSHDQEAARNRAQVAMSYYFEGDYSSAADAARRTIAAHPGHPLAYRWLAASLGQLGRAEEAGVALNKAIQTFPQSFHFYVNERPPWMRPEDHAHMMEGLRKAGWQR